MEEYKNIKLDKIESLDNIREVHTVFSESLEDEVNEIGRDFFVQESVIRWRLGSTFEPATDWYLIDIFLWYAMRGMLIIQYTWSFFFSSSLLLSFVFLLWSSAGLVGLEWREGGQVDLLLWLGLH